MEHHQGQSTAGFDATTPASSWTRRQRAELALALGPQMRTGEIAQRLGVSSSTVRGYLSDPDGGRARARAVRRDAGTCKCCGGRTGAARGSRTFNLCPRCSAAGRATWTREQVLDAYGLWRSQFGAEPSSTDWNRTHATRRGGQALERFCSGRWPSATVVARLFGGWPLLAEAARSSVREMPAGPELR